MLPFHMASFKKEKKKNPNKSSTIFGNFGSCRYNQAFILQNPSIQFNKKQLWVQILTRCPEDAAVVITHSTSRKLGP